MKFTLKEIDKETALEILAWRYEEPYDFYNNEVSKESLGELIGGSYRAVYEDGRLFGFFCAGTAAQVPRGMLAGAYPDGFIDIGLGMVPDGTGQGNGQRFFAYAVSAVQNQHPGLRLRLTVAEFNKRAIRLYCKSGFREAARFCTDFADFITMERDG